VRAGFAPRGIDLFADTDLRRLCPARQLSGRYPQAFLDAIASEGPGPWMYTGGLENWPRLVGQLARHGPLWGNDAVVLRQVRDPWNIRRILQENGLPAPRLEREPPLRPTGRWLVKPLRGAGGNGVRFAEAPTGRPGGPVYYQDYISGGPVAAIFIGDGRAARLLGVTRQLVGEPWLAAAPFHYCGSIGPLNCEPAVEQVGEAVAAGCRLRGLFGVDGILCEGKFWTVEVNPRYTASIEVLEYATGLQALHHHAAVFTGRADEPPGLPRRDSTPIVGKAILFARQPVTFPEAGPWSEMLHSPIDPISMPPFADLPSAGEHIETGRPILTFFTQGDTGDKCQARLQQMAVELERALYR
jgi:predicted ATP-grasp superfamily ATP-dependent carboligase